MSELYLRVNIDDDFEPIEIDNLRHEIEDLVGVVEVYPCVDGSELAALEAVAEAAEEYTKVHGHNFGSGCACLLCEVEMALDALKGAE